MIHARIGIALCAALCTSGVAAQAYEIPSTLWDRPRTARAITEEDSVKQAVRAALAKPDSQLVIRHGAGQEARLEAEELKSWLGALAIDPRRVILRSDLAPGALVKLEVSP